MDKKTNIAVLLLRLGMGWMFFYAGITKVLNPEWSAVGYLKGAKTFPELYAWFMQPEILPIVNFLNEWGLTLIGAALILGILVKWASIGGILLMALYYIPILDFPMAGANSYIVDQHVIYALVFILLIVTRAGAYWGFDRFISRRM